jgi:hypothetical protein
VLPLVVVSISLIYSFTFLFLSIFAFTKKLLTPPRILTLHPSNRKYVVPYFGDIDLGTRSHFIN